MTGNNILIHLWLIWSLLGGQANCAVFSQNDGKVKFNEAFTLRPDERVRSDDGKLRVRLKGVGRTISEGGEVEYVELQVWHNKSNGSNNQ